MSYFAEHYDAIRLPVGRPGLRQSQLGAIHALASHYTLHETQAIVVLPTGSGKTAVLMLTPYLLRGRRALVITPSVFVRDQIAEDYAALSTLKRACVFPDDLPSPQVHVNRSTVTTSADWEAFSAYDVVIATPDSVSPGRKLGRSENVIPDPPPGLFDIVLMDEAHHAAASSWAAILTKFSEARRVLFTATPFRRDGREVKGHYVYTYPIQRAFDDGTYGKVTFTPVEPGPGVNADAAIAQATARVFQADRAAGLKHAVMVRASSRAQADTLADLYAQETPLNLRVIHSGHSYRHVQQTVTKLREGELDGVVCVDMLGEGFDLPNLKIAALHAPHRSLAITLQFVGRFARTTGEGLGDATLLALPSELEVEEHKIYRDSAAWQQRLFNIAHARAHREERTREVLGDFQDVSVQDVQEDLKDLSLYTLKPLNHVKVFQVFGDVDLDSEPALQGYDVVRAWLNTVQHASVFLTRERVKPKWADTDHLTRTEYDLFVVYHHQDSGLLFVCATRRDESLYQDIARRFVNGHAQPLSLSKINRVLRDLQNPELFSVGMRNRNAGTVAEAYRMLSGSGVHEAIQKSDGQLYHRGHVFGRADGAAGKVTIGVSSLSKVWRSDSTRIPELLEWCDELAAKIMNDTPVVTASGLDFLSAGEDVTALPTAGVIAADWEEAVYAKAPHVTYRGPDGHVCSKPLLNFDVVPDRTACTADELVIRLNGPGITTRLKFSLTPYPVLDYIDDTQPLINLDRKGKKLDLVEYLQSHPLRFFFEDGSSLQGHQHFPVPDDVDFSFDFNQMQGVDWTAANVEITKEYKGHTPPARSIHEWLEDDLRARDFDVVLYDHGNGECADYLTVKELPDGRLDIGLYHCKGAGGKKGRGGKNAGDRVDDLYEVCGQAVKSLLWRNKKRLMEKVRERVAQGSCFKVGDMQTFMRLVSAATCFQFDLEIFVVQPGVSASELSAKLSPMLAAANGQVLAAGCRPMRIICAL